MGVREKLPVALGVGVCVGVSVPVPVPESVALEVMDRLRVEEAEEAAESVARALPVAVEEAGSEKVTEPVLLAPLPGDPLALPLGMGSPVLPGVLLAEPEPVEEADVRALALEVRVAAMDTVGVESGEWEAALEGVAGALGTAVNVALPPVAVAVPPPPPSLLLLTVALEVGGCVPAALLVPPVLPVALPVLYSVPRLVAESVPRLLPLAE